MDAHKSELETMKEILGNLAVAAENSNIAHQKTLEIVQVVTATLHGFEERIAKLEAAVSKDRGIESEEDLHG